jgi:hypothetical protein
MIAIHAKNQMNLGSLTNLILLLVESRSDFAVEQEEGKLQLQELSSG